MPLAMEVLTSTKAAAPLTAERLTTESAIYWPWLVVGVVASPEVGDLDAASDVSRLGGVATLGSGWHRRR